MEKKRYVTDSRPGRKAFSPSNLAYRPEYVYAWSDPCLMLLFWDHACLDGFGEEIVPDEENGRAAVREGVPGALEKWYSGIGTYLYTLEDRGFHDGVTGWETLSVTTETVAVTGEKRIGDVYGALLQAEREGLLAVYRYREGREYQEELRLVRERSEEKENRPVLIIEEGRLLRADTIAYAEEITVPPGVDSIGWNSMCETMVGRVVIPEGVTVIEEGAFYDSWVSEVVIPGSVERIESYAFGCCENLRDVTVPPGVTRIEPWAFGYRRSSSDYSTPVPNRFRLTVCGEKGSEAERYALENEWHDGRRVIEFREMNS